jgi:hypothetical protein
MTTEQITTRPDQADRTAPTRAPSPPKEYHPWAGVLSYLVPGLGQIVQGRTGKGILFLVCVYALFFYGLFLGAGTARGMDEKQQPQEYLVSGSVYLPDTSSDNQIGLRRLFSNLYNRPQYIGQFCAGVVSWPAVWQYMRWDHTWDDQANGAPDPLFGHFMQAPTNPGLNAVHTGNDKSMDLGWVFSVIAGVLNVMVIYDAVAGPAFPTPKKSEGGDEHPTA